MSPRHLHCPECGAEIAEPKRRSIADHRRLFALIRNAFDNWPERHEFQPDNAEHLRAWLVCKAGWRMTTAYDLGAKADPDVVALALQAGIKAAKGIGFVTVHNRLVAVVTPKSMDFRSMAQAEFGHLRDAISDVIEAETGIKPNGGNNDAYEAVGRKAALRGHEGAGGRARAHRRG